RTLAFVTHAFARDKASTAHQTLCRGLAACDPPDARGWNRFVASVQKLENRKINGLAGLGGTALLHFTKKIASMIRQLIFAFRAQFGQRREHGPQRLSDGRDVIAADPNPQFD